MKPLREIHLYLGCIFAPMIMFFCLSGIWQTLGWQWPREGRGASALALLSTLHTGRGFKVGDPPTLSSPLMHVFVVVMAACLMATICLGVFMAFKFGHRRPAMFCLALGVLAPAAVVALTLLK